MQKVIFGQVYEVPENSSVALSLYEDNLHLRTIDGDKAAVGCRIVLYLVVGHTNIPSGKWEFRRWVTVWRQLRGSRFPTLKCQAQKHRQKLESEIPLFQPALHACFMQDGLGWEDIKRELTLPLQKSGWNT